MRESQLLELYTFCLIDFESGIVSYIGINGAPKISAVRNLFDRTLEPEENTSAHLAAIMTVSYTHLMKGLAEFKALLKGDANE